EGIDVTQRRPSNERIRIRVTSEPMNGERVRTEPPPEEARVEACSKVREPNLRIVFLTGVLVALGERGPIRRVVLALHATVGEVGEALDQLAGRLVHDSRRGAEGVGDRQEDVLARNGGRDVLRCGVEHPPQRYPAKFE